MKKGLFVYYDASQIMKNPQANGIYRKIIGQISALNIPNETECDFLAIPRPNANRVFLFILYLFCDQYRDYYSKLSEYDFLYFRRFIPANRGLICLLKRLNKVDGLQIFYEFPTFPYDKEHKTVVMKVLLWIDRIFRRKLKEYVDYAVVIGDEQTPFGIRSVNIDNGIQCDYIRPTTGIAPLNEYHLFAVANFQFYHGYDRVIKGIKSYYESNPARKVVFHLAGPETEESIRYEKLVKEYNLSGFVIFHGPLYGKALDEMYDRVNIGLGSLARFRTGIDDRFSDLKTREYIARGIPIVTSTEIPFVQDEDFVLHVPNDDSEIDIMEIVSFLDALYAKYTPREWAVRIRNIAERFFDISVTMNPVIEVIAKGKR